MMLRPRRLLYGILTLGLLSVSACQTNPPPNALEEGRSCYLGVVPPSQVEQVQVWAASAQAGDYLLNPACDAADMLRVLTETRRNTR